MDAPASGDSDGHGVFKTAIGEEEMDAFETQQVLAAHHISTLRKDRKGKHGGDPYCQIKVGSQTKATTTATFNGNDLEWSDPVMPFKLTSMDDVRLEITLLAADILKSGGNKAHKPPPLAGELCILLYCEYGNLGQELRKTISGGSGARQTAVGDEQDIVYINKALEEKFRNVRIQIWEKKRQSMQSEAQLNKMASMLGESEEILEQRKRLAKMWEDIVAMETMIGMTVDQDPRKDLIVNKPSTGQESASVNATIPSADQHDKQFGAAPLGTKASGVSQPAGKSAMRCVRAFQSDQPTHLAVTVGELVTLLAEADPGWFICQRGRVCTFFKAEVYRMSLKLNTLRCELIDVNAIHQDKELVPDGYIQIEPESWSTPDLLSGSPGSPGAKAKSGLMPFARRSVRAASHSASSSGGSQSGTITSSPPPGLRAQISHLGSSFFGGGQQPFKSEDSIERLTQMIVEVQKTLLETLVWQARTDDALDDILARVAGQPISGPGVSRVSLQDLPESTGRSDIKIYEKPKPKGRKTGLSKAMNLLRSDSMSSGHENEGAGDKQSSLPTSPPVESNTALRLEFALKEKEYIKMITDLQAQLRNKDLAMKQREIELRDSMMETLESRMKELLTAKNDGAIPPSALPLSPSSAGAPPPPPPPGPRGPPPPPPPPGSLATYEKKTTSSAANQNAVSDKDGALEKLISKLDQLDKLDSILQKLNSLNINIGMAPLSGAASNGPTRSMEIIQKEMAEQMSVIMDGNAGEREREDANIKYEKLMNELEQNPEYRAQLEAKRKEKEARDAPLNKAAAEELRGMFTPDRLDANPELRKKVQKNPELTLIVLDHKAILSKHENDFKTYTMRGLVCKELRAIMGSLPEFKKNQTVQIEWKERLAAKIDETEAAEAKAGSTLASLPKAPAPSAAKKFPPVSKRPAAGKPGDFLAELRARQAAAAAN